MHPIDCLNDLKWGCQALSGNSPVSQDRNSQDAPLKSMGSPVIQLINLRNSPLLIPLTSMSILDTRCLMEGRIRSYRTGLLLLAIIALIRPFAMKYSLPELTSNSKIFQSSSWYRRKLQAMNSIKRYMPESRGDSNLKVNTENAKIYGGRMNFATLLKQKHRITLLFKN